jgi:hypothetical protein
LHHDQVCSQLGCSKGAHCSGHHDCNEAPNPRAANLARTASVLNVRSCGDAAL